MKFFVFLFALSGCANANKAAQAVTAVSNATDIEITMGHLSCKFPDWPSALSWMKDNTFSRTTASGELRNCPKFDTNETQGEQNERR